jgi:hypothetical protein
MNGKCIKKELRTPRLIEKIIEYLNRFFKKLQFLISQTLTSNIKFNKLKVYQNRKGENVEKDPRLIFFRNI